MGEADEGCGIGVEVSPGLPELSRELVVEETGLLDLGLVVTLQDDCDKKLEKDKAHNEGKTREISVSLNF